MTNGGPVKASGQLEGRKEKNDAPHRVIKAPAHRSTWHFKIPNNHRKTKYAIFQGGLISF
jgi:hypothetical protein